MVAKRPRGKSIIRKVLNSTGYKSLESASIGEGGNAERVFDRMEHKYLLNCLDVFLLQ